MFVFGKQDQIDLGNAASNLLTRVAGEIGIAEAELKEMLLLELSVLHMKRDGANFAQGKAGKVIESVIPNTGPYRGMHGEVDIPPTRQHVEGVLANRVRNIVAQARERGDR